MGNSTLHRAKRNKRDEFYTRYEDIAKEVQHYKSHFKDKHVLLNANDAKHGYFWDYFNDHFVEYGLASLTATSYGEGAVKRVRDSVGTREIPLQGDGDFRSDEMLALLSQSDVVVTNPPFSLFRDYLAQLVEYDKKFLVIGNTNAITYKEIWPLIQYNKLWLGMTRTGVGQMWFRVPDDAPEATGQRVEDGVRYQTVGNTAWFTNLDHAKRHEELPLWKKYTPEEYPKYDNYDAINVNKVKDIPVDYDGAIGVPITFLGKWNPEQFEIVGCTESEGKGFSNGLWTGDVAQPLVAGERKYKRIFVKRKV